MGKVNTLALTVMKNLSSFPLRRKWTAVWHYSIQPFLPEVGLT